MTASSSPLNWRGLLSSWLSTIRITRASAGSSGVEIVQAAAGNRPNIRPFSNEGETDIDLDIFALGSGVVRVNGSVPVSGSIFAAKGDVLGGTGTSTYDNLAVGANGTVLTADSAETTGLKWAAPSATVADGDKGDITVSSTGTVWTIDADAVTYAKIQDVSATDRLLGRSTAGAGIVEEITCTAAGRALLDDATASDQRTTLGLGTLATQSGTFSGTSSGTNTGDQTITLTGGVTGSGTGSFAATVVTNANLTGPITSVGNATTIADAELAALAGLTSAADGLPYFTGSGTAALTTLTSFARSVLDDVDAAAVRATIGAGTGSGDALTSGTLAQFAATTSLQLLGVMSDETGSGSLVFGTSPTLTTPRIDEIRDTNGNTILGFTPILTSVNYAAIQNNITGSPPRMTFTGSDTNVDGILATKGSGRVRVRYSGTNYEVAAIDLAQTITNKTFAAGSGNTIDAALLTSGTVPIARVPLGSSGSTVCVGNDSRLSDSRTPTTHASSHQAGGGDEIATATAASGAIPKAGSDAKLGQAWIPEGSHHDYAHAGTSEYEAWFAAACTNSIAMTSGTPTADRLYAFPFVAPGRAGCTLDRLGINVTSGVSGNCRIGIYNDSGGYPGTLVLDGGALSTTSTAVVTATISQALTPGNRYWMAAVFSAAPTVRTLSINSCSHALGTSSSLGTASNVGLYVSYTYGALPTPFPSTPTMIVAAPVPALFYRFSA